jgi:2-hydroxychromene-2-carboxylate isomerase
MNTALTVLFDFKDPYSYLALGPTLALVADLGIDCDWQPFLTSTLRAAQPAREDDSRGDRHRRHRAEYTQRDLKRYAESRGLPARHFANGGLYRPCIGEVAAIGFNWLRAHDSSGNSETSETIETKSAEYLNAAFAGYWDGTLDLDAVSGITELLADRGCPTDGFAAHCQQTGPENLESARAVLIERGAFTTPTYLLDDEAYVGRQHLPMIRWRLTGSSGSPPI